MTIPPGREPVSIWCPIPRDRLHFDGCPYWAKVIAEVQAIQDNPL